MPMMKPRMVANTMPSAGDQQRVEQADPEGAAIGRGRDRIVDQRLADVEAGGVVPEAEARGDMRALPDCSMALWIGAIDEERDDRAQHDLIGDAADLRIVVERTRAVAASHARSHGHRASRRTSVRTPAPLRPASASVSGSAARTAMPPLVHSAFRPRAIFSGEPCADIALEHLAVIADLLDDAVPPSRWSARAARRNCPRCRAAA